VTGGHRVTETDVLVLGGVGVDTVVRLPALPPPYRDSTVVPPVTDHVGHTGHGVARTCRALGLRTALVDLIGDDPQGAMIRSAYARAGIALRYAVHPAGTRRSVNLVGPDGARMALYDPRHPPGATVPADLYRAGIARARHVHATIVDWARAGLADAVAAGVPTSTDLHDWDGDAEHHRDFAYAADLVFLSTAALVGHGGAGRVDAVLRDVLARGRARAVVATAGGAGSLLLARGDAEPVRVPPATPPGPVIDSNGAGDSYVAAFLSGQLAGADLLTCARMGAVAGAYACTAPGADGAVVDRSAVEAVRDA
jgi:sugar/nucleoside kinase (ribokinase family)